MPSDIFFVDDATGCLTLLWSFFNHAKLTLTHTVWYEIPVELPPHDIITDVTGVKWLKMSSNCITATRQRYTLWCFFNHFTTSDVIRGQSSVDFISYGLLGSGLGLELVLREGARTVFFPTSFFDTSHQKWSE